MPISKTPKDEPAPQDVATVEAPEPAPAVPDVVSDPAPAEPVPAGVEPGGAYEFTHFADCVYPHVPLTARAATPDAPATVFDWPFGPPADGRWTKTTRTPNQAADNAGPLTHEE
ncbi:hypothetical protein ACGF3G_00340 [Streptomyces sp. NPDC048179]|uniref:hypothetical protein n=1 Tax=Streptomyces sp. NPDC048179 TaxID=3365506 RepID=UPI0037209CB4